MINKTSTLTELDYALNVAQMDINTTNARAELSALRARVEQAERERDELKALLAEIRAATYMPDGTLLSDEVKRIIQERDEARARVAELEAAARWACESWPAINDEYYRPDHEEAMSNLKDSIGFSEDDEPATLTPRRCGQCCTEAAKAMREAAADCADNCDLPYEAAGGPEWSSQVSRRAATSDAIRALPLPSCNCNPLKTEAAHETA